MRLAHAFGIALVLSSIAGCGEKPKMEDMAGTYVTGEGDAQKTLTVTKVELKIEKKTGSSKLALLAPTCDKPGHCTADSLVGKVEVTKEGDKLTVVGGESSGMIGGEFAGTYTKK